MKKKPNLSAPTLDLHGYAADDVYDAVERFVSQHMSRTTNRVRLMSGKGSGKVKAEVLRYLKDGGFPWKYEVLENGKTNEGVMVVFLA